MIAATYWNGRRAWAWTATAFAVQAAGSVVVQRLFQMEFAEVLIPVSILLFGAALGFGLMFHAGARKLGSRQWWIPSLLYALFIFSLSARSHQDAVPAFSTKIFHPVEFLVFTVFLCMGRLPVLHSKGALPFAFQVLCAALLFAASDEWHQSFVPGRTPAVFDVLFWDLLGILPGLGGVLWLVRRFSAPSTDRGR